jgi:alpha-tubulin suppressor-like RCC1 family protein
LYLLLLLPLLFLPLSLMAPLMSYGRGSRAANYCNSSSVDYPACKQCAKQIVMGGNHMCVLLFDGSVKCAGDNQHGQLWLGTAGSKSVRLPWPNNHSLVSYADVLLPAAVLDNIPVRIVSCGFSFGCAVPLAEGNTVYCTGRSRNNFLGNGDWSDVSVTQPVKVLNLLQTPVIAQLASGADTSCVLYAGPATSSSVQCWSDGYEGTNYIAGVDMARALAVSLWGTAGCVVLHNATLACWDGYPITTTVSGPSGVVHVTMGGFFVCAVVKFNEGSPGTVWCWSRKGRTGSTPFVVDLETPQLVQGLPGRITDVVAGNGHVCALVEISRERGGEVYCWGENRYGQLGQGYTNGTSSEPGGTKAPQQVKHLMNVTALYAGSDMTCAVTTIRQVFCWGRNPLGMLGGFGSVTFPRLMQNLCA